MEIVKLLDKGFGGYEKEILELLIDSFSQNFDISTDSSIEIGKEKLAALKTYVEEEKAIVLANISEGTMMGFIWIHKHEFFDETRLHINQLAVNPQFRGKGIAKQLIRKSEELALELGIKTMDLSVSENNKSAIKLYEKLGFDTERRLMKMKL